MNKLNINVFSKEEQEVARYLLNSIDLNSGRNEATYFLTASEQIVLEKIIASKYSGITYDFFGGYIDAERKKAKIIANEYYDIDYDIICLHAQFNKKFHDVKHRDVMGAVHNLGINFNRIGDIVVKDNNIYIFVDVLIAEYVATNLSRIGKAVLDFREVTDINELAIEREYDSINIVSSSHRLDAIVAKIINKARSKAKELLDHEHIKLNHTVITNGEKNCNIGDMISIRKYGRFVIRESNQNTKTQKYRIRIDKLV